MPTRSYSAPEPLEARIAPAATLTIAVGGHNVTVKSSLGTTEDLAAALGTQTIAWSTLLLPAIDLADHPVFKGSDFSIVPDDGVAVAVGDFNATGLNLGTVVIGGDVDQIEAGNSSHPGTAIKSLHIKSLNTMATATNANPGTSTIFGGITTLTVDGDFDGAFFLNSAKGSIKTATIGGNMVGGAMQDFGTLSLAGALGSITVTGGLMGGSGSDSGSIEAHGTITKALVGSISGGTGFFSGQIMSQANITAVTVTGAVTGSADAGSQAHNGQIFAAGKITTATLGSLVGGAANLSGTVTSALGLGTVTVGAVGNTNTIVVTGGAGTQSGAIGTGGSIGSVTVNGGLTGGSGDNSADIQAVGAIATVTVHGAVRGGSGVESGAIGSTGKLGKVAIDGGLEGGSGASSGQVVSSTSIDSVTVGTSSFMANVVGGSNTESGSIGSLGKVGSVTISGTLMGGDGLRSGVIISGTAIGSVSIGGSVSASQDGGASGSDASILAPVISSVSITGTLSGGNGDNSGEISGTQIGTVHIGGNISGGSGNQSGEIRAVFSTAGRQLVGGSIGDVTVGGSLVAGINNGTGSIISFGSIKSVTVDGSLEGSNSVSGKENAGSIVTVNVEDPFNHDIGSVVVKGSLIGGDGDESGAIEGRGNIASVTVGVLQPTTSIVSKLGVGDVAGGAGAFSGSVSTDGQITKLEFFGSLIGSGSNAGVIFAGSLPSVHIHGDIEGGSGQFSGSIQASSIGAITVEGNIVGDVGDHAASIVALGKLNSLNVFGDIEVGAISGATGVYISGGQHLGSVTAADITGTSSAPVVIASRGLATARTQAQTVAIDKITVGGEMSFTQVLAGFDQNGDNVNGHVSIGTIALGTRSLDAFGWDSNTIKAGAVPDSVAFYTDGPSGNHLESQIAKITIGNAGIDPSGTMTGLIVADHVLSISITGGAVSLMPGKGNDDLLIGPSGAVQLYEIGAPLLS